MVISKTPYRMSFLGGGTDYPDWYMKNGGAVLATAIDKYCYIRCRYLPPFFEHKSRIVYSQIELVNKLDEIQHPSVREVLRFLNINQGVEIHHNGDVPSRSGLGSSSAFTVGLLNSLYALKGIKINSEQLAREAILIEQEKIGENIGSQDQISAAYGGFNRIGFDLNGFNVEPVALKQDRLKEFQSHLMLFFTGVSRTASQIAGEQIKSIPKKKSELKEMHQMVDEGIDILQSDSNIEDFGKLLHQSWMIKRGLTNKISSNYIDTIYENAQKAGAIGGKILGAGGGGFILFFIRPELQESLKNALPNLLHVPFEFENSGSKIIYQSE